MHVYIQCIYMYIILYPYMLVYMYNVLYIYSICAHACTCKCTCMCSCIRLYPSCWLKGTGGVADLSLCWNDGVIRPSFFNLYIVPAFLESYNVHAGIHVHVYNTSSFTLLRMRKKLHVHVAFRILSVTCSLTRALSQIRSSRTC